MSASRIVRAVLGCFVLMCATRAWAQPARFEVSPYLGYRFGGGLQAGTVNQPTLPGLEDLGFKNNLNLGLSGTVRLHRGILAEVFGERMSSGLEVDEGSTQPNFPQLDLTLWYLHAGVNWEVNNSEESQLRPLVGVSVGTTVMDPTDERASEARFSIGILLGVKYFPGDTWGVRLHGRFMSTYLAEGSSLFQDASGDVYTIPETTYMTQFDFSAGLVFPFGATD